MSANIEIKARIGNIRRLRAALRAIGAEIIETVKQEDTFFAVPRGRLKMRRNGSDNFELVYYRRPNAPGPSVSNYFRKPIDDAEGAKRDLERLFGIRCVVRKNRQVFLSHGARIHLDDVEGLGRYLEVEVPVERKRDLHRAMRVAQDLILQLAVQTPDLVSEAYEELLCNQRAHSATEER
ncbi:MAG TPA: class IV adenylate cyclase [Candidatus Acidoferrum sp.]|nr:class IV adenylate cyclase [Candidatus Acidoferrum sp.]